MSARTATSPPRPTSRRGCARRSARRWHAGDLAAAAQAFGTLARLHELLYGNGGIRVTKAVLDRLGLPGGAVRPPQLPPADDVVDRVLAQVRAWGLDQIEGWDPAQPPSK